MTVARPVRLTAAVALTGVVLAGCAEAAQQVAQQSGLTPAARVDAATGSLLDTERLTVTASLDLDEANTAAVTALATRDGEVSAEVVERVLGTRLVATTVADEGQLSDLSWSLAPGAVPAVSTSVALEVEGEALAEVRQVGTVVYARADLAAIEDAYEAEGAFDALADGLGDAPPEVAEPLEAMTSGEWVSLDTADLAEQLESLGMPAPEPADEDAERASAAVEGFLSEAAAVLRKEVVVTETGTDSYEVTAPLDRVVTSLTPSITSLVGELVTSGALPEDAGVTADELVQEVTSGVQDSLEGLQDDLAGRTATVQVGLDGERLASARFDVVQVVDEDTRAEMAADDVTSLPVLLTFAHEGEVTAPQGATAVDLETLVGGFGTGLQGVPMGEMLDEGLTTGGGFAVEDVDPSQLGQPLEATAEELAEMGLSAEALGMGPEEFDAFLAQSGIVLVP